MICTIRLFLDRLYEVADLLTERPTPEPPDPQEIPSRALNEPLRGLVGLKLPWTRKWIFQLFVKKRRRKISTQIFGRSFPVELQSLLCYLSILPLLKLSICAGSWEIKCLYYDDSIGRKGGIVFELSNLTTASLIWHFYYGISLAAWSSSSFTTCLISLAIICSISTSFDICSISSGVGQLQDSSPSDSVLKQDSWFVHNRLI